MEEKLKAMMDKDQLRDKPVTKLRSNELNRLLSLKNKINWKKPLSREDEHDLEEIKAIQEGQKAMAFPEQKYFQAAFTRHWNGKLCWFQNLYEGPLRELTDQETELWNRTGPVGLFGYIRADGTIQAYVLSGSEKRDPQLSPSRSPGSESSQDQETDDH
jgi:hypothetical protein